MSEEPTGAPGPQSQEGARDEEPTGAAGPRPQEGARDEEEMRRAMEEQVAQLRMEDVLIQSVASMLNLAARRIGKEDERDLEQARLGIEACRRLAELLPEEARNEVRNALSEVQMLFARTAQGTGEAPSEGAGEEPGGPERSGGPGDSGLWVPPGS